MWPEECSAFIYHCLLLFYYLLSIKLSWSLQSVLLKMKHPVQHQSFPQLYSVICSGSMKQCSGLQIPAKVCAGFLFSVWLVGFFVVCCLGFFEILNLILYLGPVKYCNVYHKCCKYLMSPSISLSRLCMGAHLREWCCLVSQLSVNEVRFFLFHWQAITELRGLYQQNTEH